MTADERRQRLSEYLARRGYVDLPVLVNELGVSESTVRRDLSQLEEDGVVRRTHGGAVFISDRMATLNYAVRETTAVAEKQAIGRAAAELIADGETILLDGGTTTFQVARNLLTRSLQVVTNSVPIASLLSSATNIELILVGGYIYPRTGVALGPIAKQALAGLHFARMFMGAAGITEEGLYNANMLLVETQEQMMRSADEVIVVADHTKFGRRSLARLCGWDRINHVISDGGLDGKWPEVVRGAGAGMILAPVEESLVMAGRSGRGG